MTTTCGGLISRAGKSEITNPKTQGLQAETASNDAVSFDIRYTRVFVLRILRSAACRRRYLLRDLSLNQPITAVAPFVQDIHLTPCSIQVDEEPLVAQQVHLLNRFQFVHR